MAPPTITVTEATGEVPVANPGLDKLVAVFGCCSLNNTAVPTFFGLAETLATLRGEGPGVRRAANIIKRTKLPVLFVPVPSSNPGTYRTIDISAFTGTAVPSVDATAIPLDEYDLYWECVNGGDIGTPGITFKHSTDNGRNPSGVTALGVADSFTFPGTGAKVKFDPTAGNLTALNTLLNELKTDQNAHVILTTGTVHTNADSGDVVATANASSTSTRVALVNALVAAAILHYGKGTGGSPATHINVAGDSAHAAILSALTPATDDETALANALVLKAQHNLHIASTTWHTIADATNVTTSAAPSAGSVVAGDIIRCRTNGPKWATSDLTDAATVVANSAHDISKIHIAGPCSASEAGSVTTMLDTLKAKGKECTAIIESRQQSAGETEAAMIAAVAADYDSFSDDRIARVDGSAWCTFETTLGNRQWSTNPASHILSRILLIDRFLSPSEPRQGPIPGLVLVNSAGTLIGHDEEVLGGFDEARGMALYRIPNPDYRDGCYLSHPYVLKSSVGRISQFQVRTVINAIRRSATSIGIGDIAIPLNYDPTLRLISVQAANAIAASFKSKLSSEFSKDISNPNDENLVTCDRAVTVSGDDAFVAVTIVPIPFKYVGGIAITIAIKVN